MGSKLRREEGWKVQMNPLSYGGPPWHALFNFLMGLGSGCGSVGRAVASDTRGPRFESSHRQKFNIEQLLDTVNCVLKRRKIKKKRPGMAHFLKKFDGASGFF